MYSLKKFRLMSDDNSDDESGDDEDYCLPSRQFVISEPSSKSEYEDSKILNLDNNYYIYSTLTIKKLVYQRK